MAVTGLSVLKEYVHATEFDDDDAILQLILNASEDYVVGATGRTLEELLEMGGGDKLPDQLTLATLMVAAARYAQPEGETSQQAHELPFGVTTMVKQFRKFG